MHYLAIVCILSENLVCIKGRPMHAGGSLRRHFSIMQKSTFMLGQELAKNCAHVHTDTFFKETTKNN
jgi:hypothetical protein